MAQRAFPNPYADYNKSLAEGYFDPEGRVSRGRRRCIPSSGPGFGRELSFARRGGASL